MKGFLYIMRNPAMLGIVKIGFSTKDPYLRARELNGTGLPHDFELVYEVLIDEPRDVEQKIHAYFKSEGLHEAKEFFRLSCEQAVLGVQALIDEFKIVKYYEHIFAGINEPVGNQSPNNESEEKYSLDNVADIDVGEEKTDGVGDKEECDASPNGVDQDARSSHPAFVGGARLDIDRSLIDWDSHFPLVTAQRPPISTCELLPNDWPVSDSEEVLCVELCVERLTQVFDCADVDMLSLYGQEYLDKKAQESLIVPSYGENGPRYVSVASYTGNTENFLLSCAAACKTMRSLALNDVSMDALLHIDRCEIENLLIQGNFSSLEVFSIILLPRLVRLKLFSALEVNQLGNLARLSSLKELDIHLQDEQEVVVESRVKDFLEGLSYLRNR